MPCFGGKGLPERGSPGPVPGRVGTAPLPRGARAGLGPCRAERCPVRLRESWCGDGPGRSGVCACVSALWPSGERCCVKAEDRPGGCVPLRVGTVFALSTGDFPLGHSDR